jgi:hypothetical protein
MIEHKEQNNIASCHLVRIINIVVAMMLHKSTQKSSQVGGAVDVQGKQYDSSI